MNRRSDENRSSRLTHVGLWFAQLALAVVFGLSGAMKVSQPMPELVEVMKWAEHFPAWLVRFIGASELAGAAGLVLPGVTRIKPRVLTVAAAGGLAVMMALAALVHIWRLELLFLPVNAVLAALAAAIVWGRL